jgi:predicted DNA-binding transcriptional regulator AlpA
MRRSHPSAAAWPVPMPRTENGRTIPAGASPTELPRGVVHVSEPLNVAVERLLLRLDEVAAALGVSRRAIERLRSAGRFPRPDLRIGRMPLWTPETIRRWVERGGRP